MNTSIPIQPRLRIMLVREKLFFGPGTFQLLQLINETGSVQLACKQMGLSYSKAWKMLETLDEQLSFKVVERQQGGSHGGRSRITPKGKTLLNRYRDFTAECQQEMLRLFFRYFPESESPA